MMNKSQTVVRLRASRFFSGFRSDRHLRDIINVQNFYACFKLANQRGSIKSKCCLCKYDRYIHLHHIDGNRKNHHLSNVATLCPNHHGKITHGEHKKAKIYAIWWRKYSDSTLGKMNTNLDYIK